MRTVALAALLLVAPAAAYARCSVTAKPVNFGIYLPFSGTSTASTGSVTVTCDVYVGDYTISLNAGSGGSFANRRMNNGGARLSYQLYNSATHTTVWGDGTGGTATVAGFCYYSCNTSYTTYGLLPARQAAQPGAYLDTIVATVTF